MYGRDKNVEKSETLERLLAALDKLTEVVAKDETSKEILASLKDKGAVAVKETPAADVRADEIRYARTPSSIRGRGGNGDGTGDDGDGFNLSTMRRLNDAFKALGGDVGAFQRTLVTATGAGTRLKAILDDPNLAAKAMGGGGSAAMSLKDFRSKYIGDLGVNAYMNKTQPDMAWVNQAVSRGILYNDAIKQANERANEKFEAEVKDKYSSYKNQLGNSNSPLNLPRGNQPGARGVTAIMEGEGLATITRIAATVAVGAAPIVLGKLVHQGAIAQIESHRPFSHINPQMAADFAMYDVNKMMGNMRVARGLSPSLRGLMESETALSQTLEPMRVMGGNVWNKFLEGNTDVVNAILSPASKISEVLQATSKSQAMLQEGSKMAGTGSIIGGILGGLAGIPGGLAGIVGGAAWGAGVGGAGGFAAGVLGEGIGERRLRELQDAKNIPHRGMVDIFTAEIEAVAVCPPRRFVP